MKTINKGTKQMASSKKSMTPVITFTKPGSKRLAVILSAPQSAMQKRRVEKAIQTYSSHTKKWSTSK